MQKLAELSGETVLLSVPVGLERMVVAQISSTHSLQVSYPIGSRVPLYVGGMGVAMLAFLPDRQSAVFANPVEPFTEFTLDLSGLRKELEQVKKEGIRVSKNDYAVGEFSVAAPILDKVGEARAALTIAGFTARLDEVSLDLYTKELKKAAAIIADDVV